MIKRLTAPTAKPVTLGAAHPNAGIEALYRKRLLRLVDEMHASTLYWIKAAYRDAPPRPIIATDASSWGTAKRLMRTIAGLGKRWTKRFDIAAQELADYFATAVKDRTDGALSDILKRGGFTVAFKPSAAVNDVLTAAIQENVSLIKSIAAQHFTQIEGMVMRSVQTGRDLKQLTDDLQNSFGVTRRRAAFIALDQNNKMTAVITRVRQLEVGVTKAVWLHSGGGHEPRPEHVGWSGQEYDVATGMWSKVDGCYVWPGTAIKCRCVSKSIVPGYDP